MKLRKKLNHKAEFPAFFRTTKTQICKNCNKKPGTLIPGFIINDNNNLLRNVLWAG
jgi:hypothetical protein